MSRLSSDDLTVFAVDGKALVLVDRAPSGGPTPRSVAVRGGRVFVLNTGGERSLVGFRDAVAATTVDGVPGIRDEALSGDGRFLYALHADTGDLRLAGGGRREARRSRLGERAAPDGRRVGGELTSQLRGGCEVYGEWYVPTAETIALAACEN